MNITLRIATLLCTAIAGLPGARAATADDNYQTHCASCHGAARLGAIGPALLPENLARLRPADAEKTIRDGRVATQMPAFGDKLNADEIKQLATLIYRPAANTPQWGEAEIRTSRIVHRDASALPAKPSFTADPMNLFVVVESGDHHVSILDGDKFEVLTRFASRYALHGGPKFSPDGRFVYFASRDGWISKYDLWTLALISEVRAGINTRNAAVSSDGKVVAVANYLPHNIVLLDADLQPIKLIPAATLAGDKTSRVSAIYDAAPRKSFIAALKDIAEAWEISYDPNAEPIHDGYVHDYKMGEAITKPGYLNPRRIPLDDYLDDFFFDQSYRHLIGSARADDDKAKGQVINLDARRRIATLDLPGMPHLGSGITWQWQGKTILATPNLNQGLISIIDLAEWKIIQTIPTPGPGFFLRSHENSRYVWTDGMMSKTAKNSLQIIDKQSLKIVAQKSIEPGKTLAHIEFTKDGRYALASLWERKADGGALIIYDANTLEEVKRIPMDKPVGKYNLYNKLTRSEGTSH